MADTTVSTDIDAFMLSADSAAARNSLGVIIQLDAAFSAIASNTVAVTGPAFCETTDKQLMFVVEGESLPANNSTARRVAITDADGNLQMQQLTGLDSARQTLTPANGELMWTEDLYQLWVGDGATIGGLSADEKRPSARYIQVGSWGTPAEAGGRLLAALQSAKDLIPTSISPVRIMVGAGEYQLSADFEMDTKYIEVLGENTTPHFQVNDFDGLGTVMGKDPHVEIGGADIVCSDDNITLGNITMLTGAGFLIPAGVVGLSQVFFNCVSGACSAANGAVNPWAAGAGTFAAGRFMWCFATAGGFASNGGQAMGTFFQCYAGGDYSFGGKGTASGSFTECISKRGSFGGGAGGTSSGRFIRCSGGTTLGNPGSFGGDGGAATGYYRDCKDSGKGFGGGGGTFSGEAVNCESYDFSGTLTGKLRFCTCSAGSFAVVSSGGTTRYCINSDETTDNQG